MSLSQQHKMRQLSGTDDADLTSGKLGVFADHWRNAPEVPERTGNYLVSVLFYEPIVALFIEGRGWYLDNTEHIGLEDSVKCWMPIPEPPRK